MDSGRMPVCVVQPSRGTNNTNALDSVLTGHDNIKASSEMQPFLKSNWGHFDKNELKSFEGKHKKRPYPIEEVRRILMKDYKNPEGAVIVDLAYYSNKKNKNGTKRKIRSEKRFAITHLVLNAILYYTNLTKMQTGYIERTTGKFKSFNTLYITQQIQEDLFKKHNMMVKTSQINRAYRTLHDLGHIKLVEQKYQTSSGKYYSDFAHIHVNPVLFEKAGISFDEFKGGQKAEVSDFEKYRLEQLSKKYKSNYRFQTKVERQKAKDEINKIKATIYKVNTGQTQGFTDEEKAIAERECPGYERRREAAPLYRDYTGISQAKDKQAFKQVRERPAGLGEIFKKFDFLKPPS